MNITLTLIFKLKDIISKLTWKYADHTPTPPSLPINHNSLPKAKPNPNLNFIKLKDFNSYLSRHNVDHTPP